MSNGNSSAIKALSAFVVIAMLMGPLGGCIDGKKSAESLQNPAQNENLNESAPIENETMTVYLTSNFIQMISGPSTDTPFGIEYDASLTKPASEEKAPLALSICAGVTAHTWPTMWSVKVNESFKMIGKARFKLFISYDSPNIGMGTRVEICKNGEVEKFIQDESAFTGYGEQNYDIQIPVGGLQFNPGDVFSITTYHFCNQEGKDASIVNAICGGETPSSITFQYE